MVGADGPRNPGKVLTWSVKLGLSATVYLMRERVTEETKHLYEGGKDCKGVRKIWKNAQEKFVQSKKIRQPNAAFLQKAEKHIRRSYNKLILNTAVRYGNTESKRRRRWENKKYINILEDFLGARLRDVGATQFPFSPPLEMTDGNGDVKRVYPGNAKIPEFVPGHVAPEQDFMDMIRSHGIELVRQCMRFGVSISSAKRYINDLIGRLIPFLEWVYTERRIGKSGFTHGANKELRAVVDRIQTRYGTRNGRPPSITEAISNTEQSYDHQSFSETENIDDDHFDDTGANQTNDENLEEGSTEVNENELNNYFQSLLDRCQEGSNNHWKQHITQMQKLVEDEILRRRDAEHVHDLVQEESRRIGAAFHDFIANADTTLRPFSLFAICRYGDQKLNELSEYLLTSELPVAKGRGRADLVLFRRKSIESCDDRLPSYIWEPCMLVEIKTRSAYNIDLYAKPTKSKKDPNRRVVDFDIERRRLTDDEWEREVHSTPSNEELEQINAYENAIVRGYKRIARTDTSPPEGLLKAFLLIDAKEDWKLLRNNIKHLLTKAMDTYGHTSCNGPVSYAINADTRDMHASLIVFGTNSNTKTKFPTKVSKFDPFAYSRNRPDNREFVLYLPVSGKGSSQQSAAAIASQWHCLQLIHEISERVQHKALWLDFSGEFSDRQLRNKRLRLHLHNREVQDLFRHNVSFFNLSNEVHRYLRGETPLGQFGSQLYSILQKGNQCIVIVTGMDVVRRRMEKQETPLLDELILHIINQLPSSASIFWIDAPVPIELTSQRFDTRCVAPFYDSSPLMRVVDEIVWNLPLSPTRYGSYIPADDDVRVVVREKPAGIEKELIAIPPLYKWGERFGSDSHRSRNTNSRRTYYLRNAYPSIGESYRRRYSEFDMNESLNLVPHLLNYASDIEQSSPLRLKPELLPKTPLKRPSLLSRTSLTLDQVKTSKEDVDGRVQKLAPLKDINYPREYRTTQLYGSPLEQTICPPHLAILEYQGKSPKEIMRSELSGLRRTIKLLQKEFDINDDWSSLLNDLWHLVRREGQKKSNPFQKLRNIALYLENHEHSQHIWMMLKPKRFRPIHELSDPQINLLKYLLCEYPNLLLFTGNQYFLLLLAALELNEGTEATSAVIEEMWEYLIPFQLMDIGFAPQYHEHHQTGETILHRRMLLSKLSHKIRLIMKRLNETPPSQTLFGKAIPVYRRNEEEVIALWLIFQERVVGSNMNATLLPLTHPSCSDVKEILRGLIRERVYWGESNLLQLRRWARDVDFSAGVEIMVSEHKGIRGLYILDESKKCWTPIGRISYYTRKREYVTLLRTLTLRQDSSIEPIKFRNVRRVPDDLSERIQITLGTIWIAFRHCKGCTCRVSLDPHDRAFELEFYVEENNSITLTLRIKRTSDVIKLLRRPDFECEPVVIEGNQLVWNRFRDIEYIGDARIIRPWVERRNPFPNTHLSLPSNAGLLVDATRERGLEVNVQHVHHACLRVSVPNEKLKSQLSVEYGSLSAFIRDMEGPSGQPIPLQNESIYSHGRCWKIIQVDSGTSREALGLERLIMNGHAMASLLKTGMFCYRTTDCWVIHEFEIPSIGDLPKEFRESYSLVEAYRNLLPQAIEELERADIPQPKTRERWVVATSFRSGNAIWTAKSDRSAQVFRNNSFTVQLNRAMALEDAESKVYSSITHLIPEEDIFKADQLKKKIRSGLEGLGYRTRLVCTGLVSLGEKKVIVKLTRKGQPQHSAVRINLDIGEPVTLESLWDQFLEEMNESRLADYVILNEQEVKRELEERLTYLSGKRCQQSISTKEGSVPAPLKRMTEILFEHSRVKNEARLLADSGQVDMAISLLDKEIQNLNQVFVFDEHARSYLMGLLMDRLDLSLTGNPSTRSRAGDLLPLLNRLHELSMGLESRLLTNSRSKFSKRLRWYLALRERIQRSR